METIDDPFLLFEQESNISLQDVFTQEAYALLLDAEQNNTPADILFSKVDNLLTVASEMLEYSAYIDLVNEAMRCSGHNHELEALLRQSSHANHTHEDDEPDGKNNKKTASLKTVGRFMMNHGQSKKPVTSLFDLLLGVK